MNPSGDDILEVFLQPGEFYFGDEKTRIRTLLGSCVAITLWHPEKKIGGMCHYMLPRRPSHKPSELLDSRYADEAMQMFMGELGYSRTHPMEYQVKLFGGGRMFDSPDKLNDIADVSLRNVEFGRQIIPQYGFKIAAEHLGGKGHRNVVLDIWSGDVWLKHISKD